MLSTVPQPVMAFPGERIQTPGEERANTWSAGFGLVLAVAGLPLLAGMTVGRDDEFAQLGAAVFGVAMVAVYAVSMLYHGLPQGAWKVRMRIADRIAIFAMIAGTYSPFALGPLRGDGGLWLFLAEWLFALAGAVFVLKGGIRWRRISLALYLAMGWLGLLIFPAFQMDVRKESLFWLLLGGLVYTAGVPFYAAKRMPYGHLVWHAMVTGGTACHYLAVLAILR